MDAKLLDGHFYETSRNYSVTLQSGDFSEDRWSPLKNHGTS